MWFQSKEEIYYSLVSRLYLCAVNITSNRYCMKHCHDSITRLKKKTKNLKMHNLKNFCQNSTGSIFSKIFFSHFFTVCLPKYKQCFCVFLKRLGYWWKTNVFNNHMKFTGDRGYKLNLFSATNACHICVQF